MRLLLRLLIGILQGIFERLPVSSSGVITLLLIALGEDPTEALKNVFFLHLGTSLAAIVYFREDRSRLADELLRLELDHFWRLAMLSVAISAVVALALLNYVFIGLEKHGYALIGSMLLVTALVLELKQQASGKLSLSSSIAAGIAQGLAVIPGLSRSGLTIAALSLTGVEGSEALRFSFIISVPAAIGAALLIGYPGISLGPLIGFLASFIVGYLTIDVLMRLASKIRWSLFLIILGSISLGFYAFS